MSLLISHTTRSYPSLPYQTIKDAIVGKSYQLSLVFIGAKRAQVINQTYRNKQTVPDVLSFPLADEVGEIYLCLPQIKKTYPQFPHTYNEHVGFLFIHGLLHLKGYEHGATMEKAERRYSNRYIFLKNHSLT